MPSRKATTVVAAVVLGSFVVAGCDTVERHTGLGSKGQVGAAGGAATGGLIAAAAGANPWWIAGSVILGAIAGGALGDYLDEQDRQHHAHSTYEAIETKKVGGATQWQNPDTGNSGSTEIDAVYQTADGVNCKDFTQTVNADGETHTIEGQACQQTDGSWKVMDG